ncbi:MAG: DUF1192 domain-containing protein [Hyphomicrobiaceae bacterium]|nr:DUF1192 domain-containing protein [Hyphomicrobiaceae bacterium]
MDWDEPKRTPTSGTLLGDVLDTLSVAELDARVCALRNEITRVEAEIAKRRAHEAAAAALFKS